MRQHRRASARAYNLVMSYRLYMPNGEVIDRRIRVRAGDGAGFIRLPLSVPPGQSVGVQYSAGTVWGDW